MAGVRALRKIQLGVETTRGTPVAATARLIGDVTFRDASEKVTPERDYGLRSRSAELGQIVRQLTEMELDTELSFEQILYPLLAGVAGGVTGAEVTPTEADYLYTFTPSQTADPAPKAYTLEYVENDGTADVLALEAAYALCKSLKLSGSQGGEFAGMSCSWFARGPSSTTPTASLAIPSRTLIPASKWQVYMDTTFAGLTSAGALDAIVSAFDWELETGIAPKFRVDADSVDFAAYQFGKRAAKLSLTLDLSAASETERASYFRTAALRFIRLRVEGSQIGAGENHRINIDGAYELVGPVEAGAEDEGQSQVTLEYQSMYDPTATKDIEIEVVNTLTAPP